MSVKETDETMTRGSHNWESLFRDRWDYDRPQVLGEIINGWRSSPLLRRIVEITTEFTLGDGFACTSPQPRLQAFLRRFWSHPLNDLDTQLREWADEAWRSGDLFALFSVDPGGFPLVRLIPAETIRTIRTAPNDYRQELEYLRDALDGDPYPAYRPGEGQASFMLHFPLNRAAGALFGESDLAPLVYWVKKYQGWLEDRASLNYYRQLFSFMVSKDFPNEGEKQAFKNELKGRTPRPGAVLVTDSKETWSVLEPHLESHEAGEDGLALKRMIATGAGLPMHYLGEPEGSTRTTADSADLPAFKRFRARQAYLRGAVRRVLEVAVEVHRTAGARLPALPQFEVTAPEVNERDNTSLAAAAQSIVSALLPLHQADLLPAGELLRLAYRFLGETPPAG